MIFCVVKHHASILYDIDSDIDQRFFCHLHLYHHYDLSGDAKDLFNFIETVTIKSNLDSIISIFKDF